MHICKFKNKKDKPCQLDTELCCGCLDIRSEKEINTIYLDEYGDIDIRTLNLTFPKSIFYCPNCRKKSKSSAEIYNTIRKTIKSNGYKPNNENLQKRIKRNDRNKNNSLVNICLTLIEDNISIFLNLPENLQEMLIL